jgi:chaperonin GroES
MRVSAHMSYQLLEEDEGWEEDQDKAFLVLPILGCVFKKSYYDPVKGHNCSKTVLPKDLVVHYYAKSIESAERKTQCFQLYDRQIKERELREIFSKIDYVMEPMKTRSEEDKRQGIDPPMDDEDRPRDFLEQHCYLDLDGDGYKEPYVVTVHKATREVVRILARFKSITTEQSVEIEELTKRIRSLAEGVQQPEQPTAEDVQQLRIVENAISQMDERIRELSQQKPKVLSIEPIEYFTKYSFIPSPDGGFYDLGFGALLSPLNDSVNTLVNQLIDAGSLQNNGGGFIGKGVRVKGGRVQFKRNEWKRVDVAGGTLKDNIVPLPINEPSAVLFQLLSLLITYAERVASVNDAMMGENPGQNTPAYNYSAMLEQGLQVFNGIFKRIYRAFRGELRKLYALNSLYMDETEYFEYLDTVQTVARADYQAESKSLIPAADPNAVANKEKMVKAQMLAERAAMVPGYNPIVVERRLLDAMDIPDAAEAYPLTQDEQGNPQLVFQPAPNPEFEIKRAEEQRRTLEAQSRHELNAKELDGKLAVMEADVVLKLAQAAETASKPEIERLKMLAQELQDRRKAVIEAVKVDGANNARTTETVGGQSGNGSAA